MQITSTAQACINPQVGDTVVAVIYGARCERMVRSIGYTSQPWVIYRQTGHTVDSAVSLAGWRAWCARHCAQPVQEGQACTTQ